MHFKSSKQHPSCNFRQYQREVTKSAADIWRTICQTEFSIFVGSHPVSNIGYRVLVEVNGKRESLQDNGTVI